MLIFALVFFAFTIFIKIKNRDNDKRIEGNKQLLEQLILKKMKEEELHEVEAKRKYEDKKKLYDKYLQEKQNEEKKAELEKIKAIEK